MRPTVRAVVDAFKAAARQFWRDVSAAPPSEPGTAGALMQELRAAEAAGRGPFASGRPIYFDPCWRTFRCSLTHQPLIGERDYLKLHAGVKSCACEFCTASIRPTSYSPLFSRARRFDVA